ncbi:polysialyltransferase family glycosyltransferase [Microtetraspora malaysiensis]|uniref:Polysialyltransferase family glycosyltransferase n=1 Tax=Microtetraspora malaysiensis TaxID=161358 RepID=A0ABW6SP26_9ACTN
MARTTLLCASTPLGAMTLAAACDEGRLGPGRRILLVSNDAAIPEITPAPDESPGFARIRDRFDEVVSWNAVIAPLHPSEWKARSVEAPMLGRLLAARLGDPDELVVESIAVPPARTLAGLLRDVPITVYSDGLMSYGPTRFPLPGEIAGRITRLLHLDLVPGLVPLLLSEHGVPPEIVSDSAFHGVVERAAGDRSGGPGDGPRREAVIVGQRLSALGILSAAEEAELHAAMLRGLAARGHRAVVFQPHPAAGRRHARELRPVAEELGVELLVADGAAPAEVCFAVHRPRLVVGCFSTALVTARRLFGIPAATVGADLVLERLSPYENADRIPATVVDASLPRLRPDGSLEEPPPVDLGALVGAVGYCMRAAAYPGLREAAAAYVEANGAARYFTRRRLSSLGLLPAPTPPAETPPDTPGEDQGEARGEGPVEGRTSRLRRLFSR